MSTHRRGQVDRRTADRPLDAAVAEQVLDSAAAGRPVGPQHLVHLLSAATQPAAARELAGEERAVGAFRTARLARTVGPATHSAPRRALAKLLTVKVAALVGTLTVGGVALAAGTGALPDLPLIGPATHTPAVHPSSPGTAGPHPGGSRAPASPALVALCRAWLDGPADNPHKAADPAFRELTAAAGGADGVDAYCADLLATPTPGDGRPGGKPSDAPTDHPTGKPDKSKEPGGPPSTHPSKDSNPHATSH